LPARHLGRSWLAVAAVAPRVAAPRQWPIARGQALRVAIIGCARRAGALDAGAPAVAEQRVRIFGQLATTRSRMSSVAREPMIGRLRGRRTRDRSRHRPSWRMRTCRHGPLNEPCHAWAYQRGLHRPRTCVRVATFVSGGRRAILVHHVSEISQHRARRLDVGARPGRPQAPSSSGWRPVRSNEQISRYYGASWCPKLRVPEP
jgi:hypothetical protein